MAYCKKNRIHDEEEQETMLDDDQPSARMDSLGKKGFMAGPDYADSFEKYRSKTTETTAALIRSVVRYVPSSPAARVIDIGCGTGQYALLLASAIQAQVFAADLSRAIVAGLSIYSKGIALCVFQPTRKAIRQ